MSGSIRYQIPELQDRLASSYVIGTMRGKARRRFETIMHSNDAIASRVRQWENKLHPISDAAQPLAPKKATWARIKNSINTTSDQIVDKLLSKLRFYKYLSAFAFTITLAIGVFFTVNYPTSQPTAAINYVAVMENNAEQAIMVVTLKKTGRLLSLDILKKPDMPAESSLQLWAVSKDDSSIASLGVVELKGHTEMNLTKAEWGLISNSEHLIMSVEQPGGSTSGSPSEQLVAKGLCVKVEDWQTRKAAS